MLRPGSAIKRKSKPVPAAMAQKQVSRPLTFSRRK